MKDAEAILKADELSFRQRLRQLEAWLQHEYPLQFPHRVLVRDGGLYSCGHCGAAPNRERLNIYINSCMSWSPDLMRRVVTLDSLIHEWAHARNFMVLTHDDDEETAHDARYWVEMGRIWNHWMNAGGWKDALEYPAGRK